MKARRELEHRLWRALKSHDIVGRRCLLACSGGADSVALVGAFAAVRPATELTVAHIHHGPGNDVFRARALAHVGELCAKHNLSLVVFRHEGPELTSEKACREVRRSALEELRRQVRADLIVTAHHQEDLLETRLIRLIRGTSAQGLPAIRSLRGRWFRPFLDVASRDLREYLLATGQEGLDDPTNRDERFLRNWVRRSWLPALEAHRPGAGAALARSLDAIVSDMRRDETPVDPVIGRLVWEKAAPAEKLRLIAGCLQAAGQVEMTRGQLEEIRKRLDNRQREFTFEMGGCVWAVNVQQIQVSRQG